MRKEPALKLERSPLVFVLSQVRFPALLKMADYLPDIQESLRQDGFSHFAKEDIQQVTFGGPEIKAERDIRWVFAARDRSEAVILAPSFVVYETSRYDVFETFTERFAKVLDLVGSVTKIDLVEQVGLRYVDLIRAVEGNAAADFLRERVRGLSEADLGVKSSRHQFMTQAQTEHGDLYVRSFENSGSNFMPPDLVSTHLRFSVQAEDLKDEVFRVLDVDHIAKGEFDFTADALIRKLWDLHDYSTKAFRAAVTEDAIEYWKTEG